MAVLQFRNTCSITVSGNARRFTHIINICQENIFSVSNVSQGKITEFIDLHTIPFDIYAIFQQNHIAVFLT